MFSRFFLEVDRMKVCIIAVFGLVLIYEIGAYTDSLCLAMRQYGQCEFYNCLESKRRCGKSGYLTGYGYKYCTKLGSKYYSFTRAGRKWIDCVRPCLTRKLIGKYKESVAPGQQCKN